MTPPNLHIVADENIPYVQDAFETVGMVKLVTGRSINSATVRDAQVLLVRSVTKVTRELLENSQIQFVGTATAGLDHIDSDYLQARGITFASAQGGNSNSVAEYVITALLVLAQRHGNSPFRKIHRHCRSGTYRTAGQNQGRSTGYDRRSQRPTARTKNRGQKISSLARGVGL